MRHADDQLNEALDAFVIHGTHAPRDITTTPEVAEDVRRFFARDDAPPPPAGLSTAIWEDLMNQHAFAGTRPLAPPNRTSSRAPQTRRTPIQPQPESRLRWAIAHIALVAVMVLALLGGYRAWGPTGSDDELPSLPAANFSVATPGTAVATPAPKLYGITGHVFIGTWNWHLQDGPMPDCCDTAIAYSNGTYVSYNAFEGVTIGSWRATGERTVEVFATAQRPYLGNDFFNPDGLKTGRKFEPDFVAVWHLTITIDDTGNVATIVGDLKVYDEDGTVTHAEENDVWTAIRMVDEPSAPLATPQPG